jgi:hypothetical protein
VRGDDAFSRRVKTVGCKRLEKNVYYSLATLTAYYVKFYNSSRPWDCAREMAASKSASSVSSASTSLCLHA